MVVGVLCGRVIVGVVLVTLVDDFVRQKVGSGGGGGSVDSVVVLLMVILLFFIALLVVIEVCEY